jgi:hypothetical protein
MRIEVEAQVLAEDQEIGKHTVHVVQRALDGGGVFVRLHQRYVRLAIAISVADEIGVDADDA